MQAMDTYPDIANNVIASVAHCRSTLPTQIDQYAMRCDVLRMYRASSLGDIIARRAIKSSPYNAYPLLAQEAKASVVVTRPLLPLGACVALLAR